LRDSGGFEPHFPFSAQPFGLGTAVMAIRLCSDYNRKAGAPPNQACAVRPAPLDANRKKVLGSGFIVLNVRFADIAPDDADS